MKNKIHRPIFLVFSILLVLIGGYLSSSGLYGNTRSTNETQTYNSVPVEQCDKSSKRPFKSRWSYLTFRADTIVNFGETTRDLNKVESWRNLQGECPYQVMDITHLKFTADFYLAALVLAIFAFRKKDRVNKSEVVDDKGK